MKKTSSIFFIVVDVLVENRSDDVKSIKVALKVTIDKIHTYLFNHYIADLFITICLSRCF
jgi:hypothetical protein